MTGAKDENGLTPQMEKFCQLVVDGKSLNACYRGAYNVKTGTKGSTVDWCAWELMENPKVSQRIQTLRDAKAAAIHFGRVEAFKQLKEERDLALKEKNLAAAGAATGRQMRLMGLDKIKVEATGKDGESLVNRPLTEAEQYEQLEAQIPFLIPMLKRLGYDVTRQADEGKE